MADKMDLDVPEVPVEDPWHDRFNHFYEANRHRQFYEGNSYIVSVSGPPGPPDDLNLLYDTDPYSFIEAVNNRLIMGNHVPCIVYCPKYAEDLEGRLRIYVASGGSPDGVDLLRTQFHQEHSVARWWYPDDAGDLTVQEKIVEQRNSMNGKKRRLSDSEPVQDFNSQPRKVKKARESSFQQSISPNVPLSDNPPF